MPDEILIFAKPGTQLAINRRFFELVALGEEGAATWRTRCVVCHSPVFSEVRAGNLPKRARCNAHMQPSRHPEMPVVEYQYQAEIGEMALARAAEVLGTDEFIPDAKAVAVKRGMKIVGKARAAIMDKGYANAQPLTGFVRMHMGDDAETSVEAEVGGPQEIASSQVEDYTDWEPPEHPGGPLVIEDQSSPVESLDSTTEDLLAELEDLAPEGGDQPPPPPPPAEEDIWAPRLDKFFQNGMWMPASWGPRPDERGCRAPQEYLDRYRRR